MPESGKIVVFDTQLLVKKAFFALVQHHLRAGLLWDSSAQQYVTVPKLRSHFRMLWSIFFSPRSDRRGRTPPPPAQPQR